MGRIYLILLGIILVFGLFMFSGQIRKQNSCLTKIEDRVVKLERVNKNKVEANKILRSKIEELEFNSKDHIDRIYDMEGHVDDYNLILEMVLKHPTVQTELAKHNIPIQKLLDDRAKAEEQH